MDQGRTQDGVGGQGEVERALGRLAAALDALDGAVAHRLEGESGGQDREAERAAMAEDRARLADELDAALARLAGLDAALVEADRRVERAMGEVSGLVEAATPPGRDP